MKNLARYLENKTHVIWDWNGTLLNDLELCAEAMITMQKNRGLESGDRERHRRLFRMPVRDFYVDMGFDLERESFDALAQEFVRHYREGVSRVDLFPGARDLLNHLKTQNKRQAILSAAHETDLRGLIRHFGIAEYFDYVYGLGDFHAASKIERGHQLLSHWNADPEHTILVGDMDHDGEVARALGTEVLILGDGHQAYERLREVHPGALANRYQIAE